MKLKTQVSTRQKTVLKQAAQLLAALLFIGILSTQVNNDKELTELENENPAHVQVQEDAQLSDQPMQAEIMEEQAVKAPMEDLTPKLENQEEQKMVQKPVQNTQVKKTLKKASPSSTLQTSSAVAYTEMKMELNDYSGKLQWASSFQRNIKSFVIEKSIDDEVYEEIGQVSGEGKGEFRNNNSYEFSDDELMYVQMPHVFYRIKQVGVNGDNGYSDVVAFDMGLPEGLYAQVERSPKNKLEIHYSAPQSGPVAYEILDAFGAVASSGELKGTFDSQSFLLETGTWNQGSYYLKLKAGKYSFMEAFVIE